MTFIGHSPAFAGDDITSVETEKIEIGMLSTGRLSTLNVWFPKASKDTCTAPDKKLLCLSDTAITNQVVVLSHGAMGSARGQSWLGEKLAAAGYVVVGVNHFGESSVYGAETQNPMATALIWQRPQDISALLDKLATQPIFQKKINWSNVVMIGHSSGGQTAAMLAGVTYDLTRLISYCQSADAKGDLGCNYGGNAASAPDSFRREFAASQRDQRIKMIVMLDPALGPTATDASLRQINVSTLVIGAKNNDFLPWTQHGQRYASLIPNAKTHVLTGQEGHFVFITPCRHQTKVMGVSLCEDREGVDRKATQAVMAEAIIKFVRADGGGKVR